MKLQDLLKEENRLAEICEVLKAIAHPTRMRILCLLRQGPQCVSEIEAAVPASQVNISQHLAVLRHAGLVNFVSEGAQRCYYLTRPELTEGLCSVLQGDHRAVTLSKEDVLRQRRRTSPTASGAGCD